MLLFLQNASSTSLVSKSEGPVMLFDVTNLTSMWSLVTEGGGFNISDIVAFVKENIGTFVSVSMAFIIMHKFHYRNICEVWLAFRFTNLAMLYKVYGVELCPPPPTSLGGLGTYCFWVWILSASGQV